MRKVRNFLNIFAFLFAIGFTGNALAAGYVCPTYMKYTSCASGYYMTSSSSTTACTASSPTAGNACRPCSVYGVGYNCSGGTSCPVAATYTVTLDRGGGTGGDTYLIISYNDQMPQISLPTRAGYVFDGYMDENDRWIYDSNGNNVISYWDIPYDTTLYAQWSLAPIVCSAGQYLPANSSSCSFCTVGSFCTGGTYNLSSSNQGITACTTLGSNYTMSTSGSSANTACYIPSTTLTADKYVGTVNSNTISTCVSGNYKAAHNYYYGSAAETCSSCSNKPSTATYTGTGGGVNSCPWTLTCSAGNYFLYNATETSRACSTCSAGNYCTGITATNSTSANSGLSVCPTSYDDGGTGLTTQSSCKFQTTAGNYIATANATTQTSCTAGYACPATLISYGSTGTITQCTGATYSGAGAGSCSSCPTSYTANTTDGKTAATQCQFYTNNGYYIANANDTSQTICNNGYYCPAGLTSYGSAGTTRLACPTNYDDGGVGLSVQSSCTFLTTAGTYVATANATTATTCTAGNYCPASYITYGNTGGSSACPTNYTVGGTGLTAQNQCKFQTTAGNYIATANATTQTSCTAGSYCPATQVNYGDTGGITACPTNYVNGGTGLTAQNQCKIQTTAGNYIATANATTQTTCPVNNSCPATLISYGSTGVANPCDVCAAVNASCSLSVVSNVCTYTTSCNTGYGNIVNNGSYNATCSASTYTVTFDKQSGTGGSTSVTATYDAAMPAATMPTRSGYAFLGYYDAISAGVQYYTSGGTSVRNWDKTSNTILYAQWSLTAVTCSAGQYLPASSSTCSTCTAGNYCAGGTFSLSASNQGLNACPTNYDDGGTGLTAQNQCKLQTTAGNYIATANATAAVTCSAGSYCPAALIAYGSTGTATACPTNYVNGGTGVSVITGCKIQTTAGSYIATANDTTQTTCTAGSYCLSTLISYGSTGGITACPTNYVNGGTGVTAQSGCKIQTTAGNYIATANATAAVTCTAGSYCPAALIAYGSTGTVTACPANYVNGGTGIGVITGCKWQTTAGSYIATANDTTQATCTAGNYCPSALISYGSTGTLTACPTNYVSGGTGVTAQSGCKIQTTAGNYIATANATAAVTCSAGSYCPAALIAYGSTGTATACPTNYVNGGTGVSVITGCKWQTTAGNYIATANATTATTCTAGSYCTSSLVSYGSTGGITACPTNYVNGGTGLTAQNQCKFQTSNGNYIATANATTQTTCTAGYACPAALIAYGSTGSSTGCAAGYYSQSGWPECDMCETGSFSDDSSDSCFSCQNGTTTSGPGATSCDTDCPNRDDYIVNSWASSIWNSNNTLTNLCYIASCVTGYSGGGLSSCTPNTYTVTFNKQSGTGGSNSVTATYDSAMPTATMPTLTNYTFVGYYDAVSAGTMYYNSTGTSVHVWDKTADTTLYARWSLSAVTCSAGQYLPANATSCVTCTAGNYCVGGTYGLSASNQGLTTCGSYAAGGTGLTAQSQCKISCSAGTYVATARGACVTLTTDDKYIGASLVNYDSVSSPNTCDTSNGYRIIGKSIASDHDSINDCYQTCSTISIAPPAGAVKTPLNTTEKYPNFCVYVASCPENYNPAPGGNHYDDSGYTSDPTCAITNYCPNTSEMINNACQPCDRENAVSYKSSGNCEVESCVSGYHPNGQACEENIVGCSVSNAEEAYKTWSSSSKSFGTCKIQTCNEGYHVSSNTCVPDQQDCALENGTGIKEWDSTKNTWGICTADSCSPGYTSDYSETNDHTKQCGQCKNKYSILGEQAVSSYTRGCDIASCMYQGELYNLENNECVPICDIAGYEDETGTMKWSPSSKKCIRQCKDGYTSWPSYSSGSSYPGGDTSAS